MQSPCCPPSLVSHRSRLLPAVRTTPGCWCITGAEVCPLAPLNPGLRFPFCKVGTRVLGSLAGRTKPRAHRELSLLTACEALLGPGLGFGGRLLANQTSLPLETMYDAVWGHPGPGHSFCPPGAVTRAGMRIHIWDFGTWIQILCLTSCVILGRCLGQWLPLRDRILTPTSEGHCEGDGRWYLPSC